MNPDNEKTPDIQLPPVAPRNINNSPEPAKPHLKEVHRADGEGMGQTKYLPEIDAKTIDRHLHNSWWGRLWKKLKE